jgi:exosortase
MNLQHKAAVQAWILPGAILLAGFVTAFSPVWKNLVQAWLSSDDNSHGLLIVPVVVFILWRKRERVAETPLCPHWAGLPVVVLSLLIYLFATFSEITTLASLSMVLFLLGAVIYAGGFPLLHEVAFPLFFLLLMIPVPAQIYSSLTIPLQLLVTQTSVWIASNLSVPIYSDGNVIHIPGRVVQVVQACSGLRSIMTLVTLGAIFGYFSLRSNPLRAALVAIAVPAAIVVNVIRIVILVVSLHHFGIDFARERYHTAFGMSIFLLSLVLMFSFEKGLSLWEKRSA